MANLPLRSFAAAIIYLLTAATFGLIMVISPKTVFSLFPGAVSAHAHLLLLGWVTVTIIGGMYQIVPTIAGARLFNTRLAWVQFWLFNMGIILVFIGFLIGNRALIGGSGALTFFSILLFVFIISKTILNGTERGIIIRFFVAALIYLIAASLIGVLMALGSTRIVSSHVHLALLGFVSMTIIGAMYQMFPMLSIRDLYSEKLAHVQFWLINVGIVGLISGFLINSRPVTGAFGALIFLSILIFAFIIFRTLKNEVKGPDKGLDVSAKYFLSAVVYFVAASSIGVILAVGPGLLPFGALSSHVHLELIGWVSLTIIGAMYHLVPMIVWMEAFGDKIGLENVPMITDLYSQKTAGLILWLLNLGIIGIFFGFWTNSRLLLVVFGALMLGMFYLFGYDMFKVYRTKKRFVS